MKAKTCVLLGLSLAATVFMAGNAEAVWPPPGDCTAPIPACWAVCTCVEGFNCNTVCCYFYEYRTCESYGICPGTPACEGCSCNSGNQEGTSGPDTLYGTADNNCLWGDAGDDVLYGYAGNDKLYGGSGDDELYGGSGEDCLWGGDYGDDYLDGGSGSDSCTQGETYVSCND